MIFNMTYNQLRGSILISAVLLILCAIAFLFFNGILISIVLVIAAIANINVFNLLREEVVE